MLRLINHPGWNLKNFCARFFELPSQQRLNLKSNELHHMTKARSEKHFGLKVISIFKFIKSILLLGVSWGFFRLIHTDLEQFATNLLCAFKINSESILVHKLQEQFISLSPATLHHIAAGALVYSILLFIEGGGLWLEYKWVEYLVIVNSGIFIPAEIIVFIHHPDFGHFSLLAINFLIFAYVLFVVSQKPKMK
jgi:uncharacterized membrane protein (DUF2068 family)